MYFFLRLTTYVVIVKALPVDRLIGQIKRKASVLVIFFQQISNFLWDAARGSKMKPWTKNLCLSDGFCPCCSLPPASLDSSCTWRPCCGFGALIPLDGNTFTLNMEDFSHLWPFSSILSQVHQNHVTQTQSFFSVGVFSLLSYDNLQNIIKMNFFSY